MSRCMGFDFESRRPCDREADVPLAAGCEHEHVGDRDLCRMHASDLRAGVMLCGDCQGVDGHKCRLYVIERPRVTAATQTFGEHT